jgi:UPF0755 protein
MDEIEQKETQEHIVEQEKNIPQKKVSTRYITALTGAVLCVVFFAIIVFVQLQAPRGFPTPSTVEFSKDESVNTLIQKLHDEEYINSPFVFKLFLKLSGRENKIPAGRYYFDKKLDVGSLAHRFVSGDFNQTKQRLTIPEGKTVMQIAQLVHEKFPQIEENSFISYAQKYEGYLFPDTYFFYSDVTKEEIVEKMRNNFTEKTDQVWGGLNLTDKQKSNIIILASLLEEEGKTSTDRKLIAGILLNRLRIGMPLQVDATINYIKGEATRVYFSELKIESDYNTYLNKGLPPGPISSPGLDSIRDALNPTPSKYLYYLTGADGVFYYAVTFDEHVRNRVHLR